MSFVRKLGELRQYVTGMVSGMSIQVALFPQCAPEQRDKKNAVQNLSYNLIIAQILAPPIIISDTNLCKIIEVS